MLIYINYIYTKYLSTKIKYYEKGIITTKYGVANFCNEL